MIIIRTLFFYSVNLTANILAAIVVLSPAIVVLAALLSGITNGKGSWWEIWQWCQLIAAVLILVGAITFMVMFTASAAGKASTEQFGPVKDNAADIEAKKNAPEEV